MYTADRKIWPYPRIIAHRGGGSFAPENTVAAIKTGIKHGHKMVEFDVKLSKDRQAFLLHDDTLNRTSNGKGVASELMWAALNKLDAGSWFSTTFRHEPLPHLADVATLCLQHDIMANIEIKPTTGNEHLTGQLVALAAQQLWRQATIPPLLSSFSIEALLAAQQAAPELPRGFLAHSWPDQWLSVTQMLGCVSIHLNHQCLTQARILQLKNAGLRILAYTVNRPQRARALLDWGVDCLCTDRLDLIDADFK